MIRPLIFIVVLVGATSCLLADPPQSRSQPSFAVAPEEFTTKLTKSHPRIIITPERLDEVRDKLKTTPWARDLHAELKSLADEFARPGSMERNPPAWKIWNSRMKRITTPALLYLLHGDKKYLDQAEREILVFCNEPENRKAAEEGRRQGLPQSSGVLGIALGYDWLYDELSPETRKRVEETILNSAFTRLYDKDGTLNSFPDNNWRQVIHGAHAVAALAIGDKHPRRCAQVLTDCLSEASGVTAHWRPDGVCTESPHYWDFGAQFYAVMLDSLETGLGDDFGLADWPVLDKTARWRVAARGPQGDFHYGDGSRYNGSLFFMSWWADRTGKDWLVRTDDIKHFTTDDFHRGGNEKAWMVLPLVWLPAKAVDGTPPDDLRTFVGVGELTGATRSSWELPPYKGPKAPGIVNIMYRSDWNDSNALWLAAVGGRANVSHGHMHGGSFVLDLGGVRWIKEMETYHYDTLRDRGISLWEWGVELQGKKKDFGREQVYAWGSKGHNTLTVNDQFHQPNGSAVLVERAQEKGVFSATLNLTAVLGKPVGKATREYRVFDEDTVEIIDRWKAGDKDLEMQSRFHTQAIVAIDGQTASWKKDGKTLCMEVVSPSDAKLFSRPMAEVISEWDKPQDDITVVDVKVPTVAEQERELKIRFRLGR